MRKPLLKKYKGRSAEATVRRRDGAAARYRISYSPEAQAVRSRARRQRVRGENQAWFVEQKRNPCVDCKGEFPEVCMDFDHVRGNKRMNLSQMMGMGYARKYLVAEIAKCDLVCANCHRIRTKTRGGY